MKKVREMWGILLVWQVCSAVCWGWGSTEETVHPLAPADRSSPRAMLNSFTESCDEAYQLLLEEGRNPKDEEKRQRARLLIHRICSCLDARHIADFRRGNVSKEAAVALKEVLDRIELPKEKVIPDTAMMEKDGALAQWTIPDTEITLERMTAGAQQGAYVFSAETVDRADEFYQSIRHLPYKEGATEKFAEFYLTMPGAHWLKVLVNKLPEVMRERKGGLVQWQWVGVSITLVVMMVGMICCYYMGRRITRRGSESGLLIYTLSLVFPIMAMCIPLWAVQVMGRVLAISGMPFYLLKFNLFLTALVGGMVVVMGLGRRVGEVIVAAPHIREHLIDVQLIRLMSRVLSLIMAMVLLLQGGKHLGIPLSSLLAGAGVVGAALALSAQDVLKNVFGSIMIILDKPYAVGERIKIQQYDGVIEEIGLRSTRIRLLNGHQAIIPNENMARSDIENVGRRPFIRRVSSIPLRLDINPQQAERAVEIILDVLKNHEGMDAEFPPRVWLSEFMRDYLELKMIYWYHPPLYWDFTAHAQWVNRQILDRFQREGIELAKPAFTATLEQEAAVPAQGSAECKEMNP